MEKSAKNTAEIRDRNKKSIVDFLKRNISATKKEVAQNLDQSFATTSNLCNQLIIDGFICKESSKNSSGGRIPELFMINENIKFTCGLNLTQKGSFELAILNLNNNVVSKRKVMVSDADDLTEIINKIKTELTEILSINGISFDNLLGIGVAAPGIYDVRKDVLYAEFFPVFDGVHIRRILDVSLGIPVYIDNDSNLLALASSLNLKCEKERINLIFLFLLEGLGAGVISEGRLLRGANGFAAEIGKFVGGLECSDGMSMQNGDELSITEIIGKYNKLTGETIEQTMFGWNEFAGKVMQGDINANKVISEIVDIMIRLLTLLISLFDPEVIFLGGILETVFEHIVQDIINGISIPEFRSITEIRFEKGGFYENVIFKGCGELVFNRFSFLD